MTVFESATRRDDEPLTEYYSMGPKCPEFSNVTKSTAEELASLDTASAALGAAVRNQKDKGVKSQAEVLGSLRAASAALGDVIRIQAKRDAASQNPERLESLRGAKAALDRLIQIEGDKEPQEFRAVVRDGSKNGCGIDSLHILGTPMFILNNIRNERAFVGSTIKVRNGVKIPGLQAPKGTVFTLVNGKYVKVHDPQHQDEAFAPRIGLAPVTAREAVLPLPARSRVGGGRVAAI